VEAGRRALAELAAARREDPFLDVVLPAARALIAGGSAEEAGAIRRELRMTAAMIAQRILDEDVRVRWFRGPLGRQLSTLGGVLDPAAGSPSVEPADAAPEALDGDDGRLLWLVVEGRSNREIAHELGVDEGQIERRLTEMYAALGVSSRGEAAVLAFRRAAV
jgi:DNA-binding NarL/FixJ family response regulator